MGFGEGSIQWLAITKSRVTSATFASTATPQAERVDGVFCPPGNVLEDGGSPPWREPRPFPVIPCIQGHVPPESDWFSFPSGSRPCTSRQAFAASP